VNRELNDIADALEPFSPYPTDSFRYMDEITATLEDAGKMGVVRGLDSAGFKGVTPEVQQRIAKLHLSHCQSMAATLLRMGRIKEVEDFLTALEAGA
jgi:hypothetical protein